MERSFMRPLRRSWALPPPLQKKAALEGAAVIGRKRPGRAGPYLSDVKTERKGLITTFPRSTAIVSRSPVRFSCCATVRPLREPCDPLLGRRVG